ncbi:DUF748 domain-containing protein [Mucilaginibacter sp. KACC 22063]|uniref:DUF748 domain-containing protein n=1 Tax=Mucilaginibacter sp. KACC 22063 TaxID=3025666 RepID=UPI002366CD3D|nr:hypothetical protein [Mucilaginibacter sp. KACC 22063]WDF55944.1 hypothetical protein PQ461_02580 [Mucilaginibacter sp. KACC 22063]
MAVNFLKSRWQKIIAAVLLGLIGLILIAAFIANRYWQPILSEKIKKSVLKGSKGLYHIDYDDVHLHILQGRVVFYNVKLIPDTNVYKQLRANHLAPDNIYEIHAKKLLLKHVHPFQLYFKHQLNIGDLVLSAPDLRIAHNMDPKKDTTNKKHQTLYQQISKSLKMLRFGSVMFNDVSLRYENYKNGKIAVSKFKELNLTATDLLIDSATQFDKSRFLFCRDVTAELYNYSGYPLNGVYSYKVKEIKFSTFTSKLNINGITLTPTAAPFDFFRKAKKDRFTIRLDSVQINNFDYNIYSKSNTFRASSIDLSNGNFIVFSNPLFDPKKLTTDKRQSFPNAAIYLIPSKFKVDTIKIKNINVEYQEYNKKTKRIGHVDFTNTHGRFYNISNDSTALLKNNTARVKLNTTFMKEAPLEVNFSFNLTDKTRPFSFNGTMGAMDLSDINPASVPLASVAVKSGYLNRLDFSFDGSLKGTKGKVNMLYNKLVVQVLKADTVKDKMKRNLLATLYANAIMISHNNPDNPGDAPRIGYVNFKRPFYFPFFKTVWNSLFNGLKPCAGLDAKKQEQTKVKMAEHERNKVEKQKKKTERKRKRLLKKLSKERKKRLEQLRAAA